MVDKNLAPVCGLYCGSCERLGKDCRGCGHVQGKPFWTAIMKMDVCPLHGCCAGKKQIEHCGLCDELPCNTFQQFHDPALSPEEAKQSVLSRQEALRRRKEIGTERWLEKMSGT
jgi:hypothetical protein